MAYATGTVASPSALATVIENFATTNGWTLNAGAGSWLSKGGSSVKLIPYNPIQINSITSSGSTATLTTSGTYPHGLTTGDLISVYGCINDLYNVKDVAVTVTSTTILTYPMAGSPGATATFYANCVPIGFSSNIVSSTTLTIVGSNTSTGGTICPYLKSIRIPAASWSANYFAFSNTSPDMISIVLQHASSYIECIHFGDIVKIHNSAYVGGNWFFAPRHPVAAGRTVQDGKLYAFSNTSLSCSPANSLTSSIDCTPIPFATSTLTHYVYSGLHCEIDSLVWETGGTSNLIQISYTDYTVSLLFRSPNSWNNQANLVPMHLQIKTTASGTYSHYLGYIEHLRLIRVDNYEMGDEITLGSDVWKIFPWVYKDASARNGDSLSSTSARSGTLGFAVRKT